MSVKGDQKVEGDTNTWLEGGESVEGPMVSVLEMMLRKFDRRADIELRLVVTSEFRTLTLPSCSSPWLQTRVTVLVLLHRVCDSS